MIGPVEFFALIALAKLVNGRQMVDSAIPVWGGVVGELLAAKPTDIRQARRSSVGGRMEDGLEAGSYRGLLRP